MGIRKKKNVGRMWEGEDREREKEKVGRGN